MELVILLLAALMIMGTGEGITPGTSGPAQTLINTARSYKNVKYCLGAGIGGVGDWVCSFTGPPVDIDCGLLAQLALEAIGIKVARTVTAQVNAAPFTIDVYGKTITQIKSKLLPGDLIAFDVDIQDPYSHTGIWTGSSLIHASLSHGKVVEVPLEQVTYQGETWYRTIYSFTR